MLGGAVLTAKPASSERLVHAGDDRPQRQAGRVAADNLVLEPGHDGMPDEHCPAQAPRLGLAAFGERAAAFLVQTVGELLGGT